MVAAVKSASDEMLRASLFERWKSRPLPDPNRPRPVVEAIKAMLTQFVQQAGPTLMPMILELLTKSLGSVGGASAASVAEPATLEEASDLQIVGELQVRCAAASSDEASASSLADFDWFKSLFLDAVAYIGPVAVQWVIVQLQSLFESAPAAE